MRINLTAENNAQLILLLINELTNQLREWTDMLKKYIQSMLLRFKTKPVNKKQKPYYSQQPCYCWFEDKNDK
ncbi:hypothetical protein GCM10009111_07530 [Colwellia asteriadis]|uniref:Transposase n=1 Tax=Colwellia asteriadis TaxID=517723 RepID=A0ABN1L435_9GAMM